MLIQDASLYRDDIVKTLKIKSPVGIISEISLNNGWCSKVINIDQLNVGCSQNLCDIPDGVYELNLTSYPDTADFYHLRICKLWRSYLNEVCKLYDSKCEISNKKFNKRKEELWQIRNIILDAKIIVEECLDKEGGLELYEYAKSLLNVSSCPNCK